ncbi:hypothetical protein BGZ76_009569 [Entomortierella beljakovae]|nr:hypothetical protein BGZ76_009569 [Entomortierella beljakovae]
MNLIEKLPLGLLGDIDASSSVACQACCYNPPEYIEAGIIHRPIINGTHMINGTIVVPVTKDYSGFGYRFNDTDNVASYILPCSLSYVHNRVYYVPTSSSTKVRASMFVGSLMLINIVLHSF